MIFWSQFTFKYVIFCLEFKISDDVFINSSTIQGYTKVVGNVAVMIPQKLICKKTFSNITLQSQFTFKYLNPLSANPTKLLIVDILHIAYSCYATTITTPSFEKFSFILYPTKFCTTFCVRPEADLELQSGRQQSYVKASVNPRCHHCWRQGAKFSKLLTTQDNLFLFF